MRLPVPGPRGRVTSLCKQLKWSYLTAGDTNFRNAQGPLWFISALNLALWFSAVFFLPIFKKAEKMTKLPETFEIS